MNCPHCGSSNADQTGAFDHTDVELDACVHDFQCKDCLGYFTVEYAPVIAKKVFLDN